MVVDVSARVAVMTENPAFIATVQWKELLFEGMINRGKDGC